MSNNSKNIMLGVLAVGVIAMTVAFAALSTNLRISGTASVPSTTWNIHFQNWTLDTQSTVTVGTNTQQNTAVYPTVSQLQQSLSPNVTLVEGVNVTLYQPGDYAKYKFQIINEGSIDASLDNFTHTMTCTSGSGCDEVINYEVKCYEDNTYTGTEVTTHSVLQSNDIVYCYLKVEYKDKTNQNSGNATMNQTYTQSALTASLSANWQWIQRQESQAQGGGEEPSGGNEPQAPSNPYETTFNGNYVAYTWSDADIEGYTDNGNGWYTTLNPNSKAYLRTDGSLTEACGVFSSGTVCLTSSYYNDDYSEVGSYDSDFEDFSGDTSNITTVADLQATGLKGYSLAKAEEMLNKGASWCEVHSYGVGCYGTGYMGCYISSSDYDSCYSEDGSSVNIYGDGSTD